MDKGIGTPTLRRGDRPRQPPVRFDPSSSKEVKTTQEDLESEDDVEEQPSTSPVKEGASFLSRVWPFGKKSEAAAPSTRSSYERKRLQAKAENQKKKALLIAEMNDLQEKMEIEQCEVDSMEEMLKKKMELLDASHPLHIPENVLKMHQEIADLSQELSEKKTKTKISAIRSKRKIEKNKGEIVCLDMDMALDLAEIDEQEDQHLGSDDDDAGAEGMTNEFENLKRDISPVNEDGVGLGVARNQDSNGSSSALNSIVQSLQTQNQALLQVLSSNKPTQSVTEKMLVRQSIGRDLPIFSGRSEEWPSFIATFKRTTASCGFTDAENVERIRKCLRGDAAKSVECLLVSPNSLPKVLKILEEKYGQADVILETMVNKMRTVGAVKEDKPQTMIEFGTAVVNLVATIKNLGELDHLKNPVLLQELVRKLPPTTRNVWEKIVISSPQKPTLEEFADWVEIEVKVACRVCPPKPPDTKKEEDKNKNKSKAAKDKYEEDEKIATAAGLFSGQAKKSCVFCSRSNHESKDCFKTEKMSWEEKSHHLRKAGACFKCFRPGHRKDSCKVKVSCATCSGPHHKPMCSQLDVNKKPDFARESPVPPTALLLQ
ncbi:hypothetical protein Fcan01_16760 [Folsomia candida]|uniref:CCHC-type domain-containing protein n=1 Tax=Folsomia candida TaxID=158441 RepID=A0A226DUV4_FOLCA|nr:hypothetical protein Fcan01_16760 [Folsomia candida]